MDKAPDAFRTISEVADHLDVPQHVLRFWETRFAQIRPMKRSGGRRYYRPDDVDLLRGIRRLLYGEGYTIRGVQKILKEHGVKAVQAFADGAPLPAAELRAERAPPRPEDEAGEDETVAAAGDAGIDGDDDDHGDDDDDDGVAVPGSGRAGFGAATAERRPAPAVPEPPGTADHGSQALDAAARARLGAVLADLIACRATLDQALKVHSGQPSPE